jgi:hypothetical protein
VRITPRPDGAKRTAMIVAAVAAVSAVAFTGTAAVDAAQSEDQVVAQAGSSNAQPQPDRAGKERIESVKRERRQNPRPFQEPPAAPHVPEGAYDPSDENMYDNKVGSVIEPGTGLDAVIGMRSTTLWYGYAEGRRYRLFAGTSVKDGAHAGLLLIAVPRKGDVPEEPAFYPAATADGALTLINVRGAVALLQDAQGTEVEFHLVQRRYQ